MGDEPRADQLADQGAQVGRHRVHPLQEVPAGQAAFLALVCLLACQIMLLLSRSCNNTS